ncbi:DUF3800 domain-containing protein [Pseudoalteromonas rubra]|uniref:DUF3800 domain-containing protein n=1 Tax=Pseudoalteromonas rubra TaxID=43658 RepID=UPI000F797DB0|nr:DUF3800 domain-containing protein [Pseudoalteromonas rubra]
MKFYYDESNNIRVLKIKNNGFNTDAHDAPSPCFVLAGIALPENGKPITEDEIAVLNKKINLPKNSDEMKFKNIASGSFLDNLKSGKLRNLLDWINKSDYLIHYNNLNMEYWSVLDIIDDLCEHADTIGALNYEPAWGKHNFTTYHKDAIYLLLKIEKRSFITALCKNDYPNVTGKKVKKLLKDLKILCKKVTSPAYRLKRKSSSEEQSKLKSLQKLLELCAGAPNLELVYEQDEGVLIDGLQVVYRYRLEQYPNETHIFDNEYKIEEHFDYIKHLDPVLQSDNYSFVDSKEHYEVQISDVMSGLFKNYFTFINEVRLESIDEIKNALNPLQLQNVELIKSLILKTDKVSKPMLHYIWSASEQVKHDDFMFGRKI